MVTNLTAISNDARNKPWSNRDTYSFEKKIELDNETVTQLGYTHTELATHLRMILNKIEQTNKSEDPCLSKTGVYYNTANLAWSSFKTKFWCFYEKQKVEGTFDPTKHLQSGEISDESNSNDPVYKITHKISYEIDHKTKTKFTTILVSRIFIKYIEEYGFYTQKNKALKVISLLSGIQVKELEKKVSLNFFEPHTINPSPYIRDRNELATLKSINGISIQKIEERARPGPGCYSQSGFLGKDESLIEVLQQDWDTVEKLGTSHVELAAHLRNILDLAKTFSLNRTQRTYPLQVEYDPQSLKGNTLPPGIQIFFVCLLSSRGYQYDIFSKTGGAHEFRQCYSKEDGSEQEVSVPFKWGDEPGIVNAKEVEVTLPEGSLGYIEEFGFYQGGGNSNTYRIPPEKIYALLTGKSHP